MIVNLLIKGCGIGVSMAMPVGPIGLLCIRHSLVRGMKYGLAAGMGAAFADAFYGLVAGFGITVITTLLKHYELWLRLVGIAFLWYLAITTFFSKPKEKELDVEASGLWSIFFSTFFLTLVNPLTIVSFAGLYTGLGVSLIENVFETFFITFGIFIGSAFWWLVLCSGVSQLGKRIDFSKSGLLNKISVAIIASFALISSLNLLFSM